MNYQYFRTRHNEAVYNCVVVGIYQTSLTTKHLFRNVDFHFEYFVGKVKKSIRYELVKLFFCHHYQRLNPNLIIKLENKW